MPGRFHEGQGGPTGGVGAAGRVTEITVVVPVYNAACYLPRTVPAILTAAERRGDVEVVFVDNHSTDGSREYLAELGHPAVRVRCANGTIAAVRNAGAAERPSRYLSFIDADCLIPPDYFRHAVAAVEKSGAAATGSIYRLPEDPHWLERVWYGMHLTDRPLEMDYFYGGNFFVARAAFEAVGGFDEALVTGEDAELGMRLRAAGYRLFTCPDVSVVHLGNAKTLRHFFRQQVWHSLGMFGTVTARSLDRPTAMLAAHLLLSLAGIALLVSGTWPAPHALAAALTMQAVVPAATVLFRARQTGRIPPPAHALLLYWLYYWARAYGLLLILRRRDYRK
jgi:glycosyltransferase involved in cell wall biosynthesis